MLGASLDVGCWMLELLRKAGDERTETIQSRALRFLVVLFYRPDRAGHAADPRHPGDDSHQHYREWLAGVFLAFRLDHLPKRFFFSIDPTGLLPIIVRTPFRVLVMTIFVIPVSVNTEIYLTEYAPSN